MLCDAEDIVKIVKEILALLKVQNEEMINEKIEEAFNTHLDDYMHKETPLQEHEMEQ